MEEQIKVKYVIIIDERGEFHVPKSDQEIIKLAQEMINDRD